MDANGVMTDYKANATFILVKGPGEAKVSRADNFPFLTFLVKPMSQNPCRVRVIAKRASEETEQELEIAHLLRPSSWLESASLLEASSSEFLFSAQRGQYFRGITRYIGEGSGYRDEVSLKSDLHGNWYWFDVGAELTIRGSIKIFGSQINSDPDYPLTFKMTDKGWILMCGRGKIKPAGTSEILVGKKEDAKVWLRLIEHENQLAREASASALGWIGKDSGDYTAVIQRLLAALNDPAWEVRRNSIESLGKLKEKKAIDAIRDLLNDNAGEGWIKAVAKEALSRIEK